MPQCEDTTNFCFPRVASLEFDRAMSFVKAFSSLVLVLSMISLVNCVSLASRTQTAVDREDPDIHRNVVSSQYHTNVEVEVRREVEVEVREKYRMKSIFVQHFTVFNFIMMAQ